MLRVNQLHVNDAIYENQNSGYDTVISSTNYLLNQNIEELRLLEGYEIHGTGNKLNNRITGNSANNILDGITGADTLIGGLGDDTYYVDDVGDVIVEYANQGTETVQSSIDTTLAANLEHLILLDFSKPELGRVTAADGIARDALVYGFPKRFELDYLQGDEVEGFEGTCALTSVANLLTQSGKPTTEGEVVAGTSISMRIPEVSMPRSSIHAVSGDAAKQRASACAAQNDSFWEVVV